jgi:hypothetical protein
VKAAAGQLPGGADADQAGANHHDVLRHRNDVTALCHELRFSLFQ